MSRFASLILTLACASLMISGCVRQQPDPVTWPWMWNWVDGVPRRASSTDVTGGNRDAIVIQPGETATIADIEGAGVIRHIWVTLSATSSVGRALVVRMYWDGAEDPAVEVPLADFFAVGHGLDAEVHSFPITVASRGRARNCWWPMPYSDGARITISNEGPDIIGAFYYYVDYMEVSEAPTNERFHAQYRQAYPSDSPEEYVFLDTEGSGRFVGVVYSIESTESLWWGEGDDRIVIDGNDPILGTGTEDYFSDAWGMREYPGLWHGAPIIEGYNAPGLRSSMYRFHVLDPLPFHESFLFSIEHGHANDRADNLSSVAYWYQVPPASAFPDMPPLFSRLNSEERIDIIRRKAWRLAVSDDPGDTEELAQLVIAAQTPANKALTRGLMVYSRARQAPSAEDLAAIDEQLEALRALVDDVPDEELYEEPTIDLPTDDDNLIPSETAAAALVLERARHDLARRIALLRGLRPGDEIIVESRRPDGTLTPAPAYEETPDYTDSYAKVDLPRVMGHGARFTYGESDPSWARFTPDLLKAGEYEVFVIFSYGSNAADTRYEVCHADGDVIIPLEQRGRPDTPDRNNREWISLGTYRFAAGLDKEKGSVMLLSDPGLALPNEEYEYRAYADAVRFVYRGE